MNLSEYEKERLKKTGSIHPEIEVVDEPRKRGRPKGPNSGRMKPKQGPATKLRHVRISPLRRVSMEDLLTPKQVGRNLEIIMERKDVEIKELEEASGVALTLIKRILEGSCYPAIPVLFKLCKALNIPAEELIEF